MTQRELGEKAHVDQAALSALELRDSNRSQFIAPIARAFGVPLDEMLALSADELVDRYRTPGVVPPVVRNSPQSAALHTAEPLALYSAPGEMQSRLLSLFDELTLPQQRALLHELETTVQANRAILQHYQGRKMRTTDDERVEATFGLPKRAKL